MNASFGIRNLVAVAVCAVAVVLSFFVAESLAADEVPVVINEVLASNSRFMADPQGQYDDWIELHNRGDAPVDLGGMYLTDDPAVPTKWQFPTDNPALTTIGPQQYLLVWADDDTAAAGLHAAFKLSAEGETIALFDRDGTTLIDSVTFGIQMTDISYGRLPDAIRHVDAVDLPDARLAELQRLSGLRRRPQFSPEHGFYDTEILVTITCPTAGSGHLLHDGWDRAVFRPRPCGPPRRAAVYGGPVPCRQDHLPAGGRDQSQLERLARRDEHVSLREGRGHAVAAGATARAGLALRQRERPGHRLWHGPGRGQRSAIQGPDGRRLAGDPVRIAGDRPGEPVRRPEGHLRECPQPGD